ncbi:MAG: hypothetical protein IPM57_11215 [Oligoflexia bacterium]|nr:hypothetical protein [Oligoflexia bacterium]
MIKKLKAFLILTLPSLSLGLVAGLYPGYKTYEYVWKNADFCLSCHVHDYATVGWQKSIHGQYTTCHDCHHQPLRAYIKEAYVMIKHRPKFPKDLHHTPYVKDNLCEACHINSPESYDTLTGPMPHSEIAKIPKIDASILHKKHMAAKTNFSLLNSHALTEQERDSNPEPLKVLPKTKAELRAIVCADCHGGPTNRGHNFSASDISCMRCHTSVHNSKMVKEHGCRSCHFQDFLAPIKSK